LEKKGVHRDPSQVHDLAQWPAPSSEYDLKSLMGGIHLYRKFFGHFSQLAHPLHQFSNHAKLIWNVEANATTFESSRKHYVLPIFFFFWI
jgi:hypothetical protein